eukprot:COSAG02_NODE_3406_length_6793_cov_7.881237_2_plen_39_part_00
MVVGGGGIWSGCFRRVGGRGVREEVVLLSAQGSLRVAT